MANTVSYKKRNSRRQRFKHFFGRTKRMPGAQREPSERNVDGVKFENEVVALRDLCFISVGADGDAFEMHRIVQLATSEWLTASGELGQWKERSISILCAEFPTRQYENWVVCQALFANARLAAEHQPEAEISQIE